jgi:DNA-binding response OmpR family regulator
MPFPKRTMMSAIQEHEQPQLVRIGPLRIDREARSVSTVDGELMLTALQFDLLTVFVQSLGKVLSFEELQRLLPRLQTGRRDPSVVRYHVARLRARLGSCSRLIENVRGCGYRMRPVSGVSPAPFGPESKPAPRTT